MTYRLAIGDRTYSSWSLRGWLLFEKFGIPVKTELVRLYDPGFAAALEPYGARLVPAMLTPEGERVGDSLAIAETLHERHPEAGIWPADPAARARARWLAAEMHSGFAALRDHATMILSKSYSDSAPPPAVLGDLARIERIWAEARARFGRADSPWLLGDYSAADAFYAPVAARIAAYNLPVGAAALDYAAAHLADPAFRRWRAMGLADGTVQQVYERDYPQRPWPGPAPLPADRCDGPSINDACPYSGLPVTDFLRMADGVWGFCNPFCRDKTLADPEAWPAFTALRAAAGPA
ncbi:glutathione S-transferase N-terminal domain-containing protein [Frigidibacter sp. MR17.14]|uniref:glutathione S-transferase N-terminal domain-containing protein n=1 Tax=Frigidibacter sp. MR17.14 TaxID=3126509 RepID=UPI003012C773